jgi:hypothetical protein
VRGRQEAAAEAAQSWTFCSCRYTRNRTIEWLRACADAKQQLQKLHDKYQTSVLLEKCFLLQIEPNANAEYTAALARVAAEAPPTPHMRVMEAPLALSRLHRYGAQSPCGHVLPLPADALRARTVACTIVKTFGERQLPRLPSGGAV